MDHWWKEFDTPSVPHASELVNRVKREEQLKQINNSYQSATRSQAIKVTFDEIKIVFYYVR